MRSDYKQFLEVVTQRIAKQHVETKNVLRCKFSGIQYESDRYFPNRKQKRKNKEASKLNVALSVNYLFDRSL